MEDLLDGLRTGELKATARMINLLLQGADAIKLMLPQAVAGMTELPPHVPSLLEEMRELGTEGRASDAPIIVAEPMMSGAVPAPLVSAAESAARITAAAEPLARPVAASRRIRVDLDRLDRLLNLTGEMGIARGRMLTLVDTMERSAREPLLEAMVRVRSSPPIPAGRSDRNPDGSRGHHVSTVQAYRS